MKLTFGINTDGEFVHVSEVERGLSCECICPVCNNPLVAKKGKIKEHHFAHHHSSECNLETALHLIAKQIIKDAGEILIPDTEISFSPRKSFRNPFLFAIFSKKNNRPITGQSIKIYKGKVIKLDSVKFEECLGDIRPDIIGSHNKNSILIEIAVTHKTDQTKIDKLKNYNLSAIEIDLSGVDNNTDLENFRNLVLYENDNRYWLNNNKANIEKSRLLMEADKKILFYRGNQLVVDDCPASKRIRYDGKPYASVLRDCGDCDFAYEISDDYLMCGGRKHVNFWQKARASNASSE